MKEKSEQLLLCFECTKSYPSSSHAVYCGRCGQKLKVSCPHCGAQFLVEEYKRCVYCGKEYPEEKLKQILT